MRESLQFDDDFLKDRDPVEELLGRLEPTPSGVDRTEILKHATQAAQRSRGPVTGWRKWFWPVSTALSLSAAITLGCLYAIAANRPEPQPRIVYVKQPVPQAMPARKVADHPKVGQGIENRRFVERFTIPEDRSMVVSLMTRSRFPALATNADNLPEARPRSGPAGKSPPTLGKAHLMLQNVGGSKRPTQERSGLSLFPWNL